MHNIRIVVPLIVSIMMIASCKVGKHYKQPELSLPKSITSDKADSILAKETKWWEIYSDSTLQLLIIEALENNQDIQIAAKKVEELTLSRKIAFADLFPRVGLNLNGEREHDNDGGDNPRYMNSYDGKFSFAWEVDLWGKLRWTNEKARSNFLQSIEGRRDIQMSIISEVAQKYFEISAAYRELSIVRRTIVARKEGVRLARLRFQSGLTSETSLRQSEVELARTETLHPALEKQIGTLENSLSLLLGKYPKVYPDTLFNSSNIVFKELPIGIPSQLLERRADIRLAEQKLIAANASVGVAFTSMFPSLKLTSDAGVEGSELSSFLKSPYWAISGGLVGPIFNMGKNRYNWKRSKIEYEQEQLRYQKSVLTAFKEVNNAILSYNKNKEIIAKRQKLVNAALGYLELANLQYINGIISYIDLLDAQRGLLDAEIGLNNALRDGNLSLIYLYKSLGGSWD
ncbi:MAG: efflux transporter outer membrane subunit [Bacteroidales bacterium]